MVGPPTNMSDVTIDGEQKTIHVLPSKHHISDARLKNTNLDEVLKLIPPGYWNEHTFEDNFGASERLFKSLSERRAQARAAHRAPETPTPPPPTPVEEPTSKPAAIHATPVPKFCAHCGHRLEPEDLFLRRLWQEGLEFNDFSRCAIFHSIIYSGGIRARIACTRKKGESIGYSCFNFLMLQWLFPHAVACHPHSHPSTRRRGRNL